MTDQLRDKIAKVYELVNRGATEGERAAAKHQLDKILSKYNLDDSVLNDIGKKRFYLKYKTLMERRLIVVLVKYFMPGQHEKFTYRNWDGENAVAVKELILNMAYTDFVTIECSYEYFRRHMGKEWRRLVAPQLVKFRKARTRNERRIPLDDLFFQKYIIASKLVGDDQIEIAQVDDPKELEDHQLLSGVEGGEYNIQLNRGLLIEN